MFDGIVSLLNNTMSQSNGELSMVALDELLKAMYTDAREQPAYLYVSLEDAHQIRHLQRLAQLYDVYPIPTRKIRKCYMRKLQLKQKQGRERIRRVERRERAQEEALMKQMRSATVNE